MNISYVKKLIQRGEGISLEFKTCNTALSNSVYETVCAFLNRNGGDLLLGVDDSKNIVGILNIKQLKTDFCTAINNPAKMSPPVYLSINEVCLDGKDILHIYVPISSQVHKCNNKIFDRNDEGDFDITHNNTAVTQLYMRKQIEFSENKIYPFCKLSDLRLDIIKQAKIMALNKNDNHPWKKMTPIQLLKSAKLYSKDNNTGKWGFTLACILLFGKDQTIKQTIPYYKTDLLLRKVNLDRYDDRDYVTTNLIDSYDRILAFGQKHLSDPFYLEGTQRISVRDKIMREIASNILIHREYLNPQPAMIVIEKNKIYSENSNKPHVHGKIELDSFSPFPKNPVIAGVFKEIGNADDLGSGVRNLSKYSQIYSGEKPVIVDGDVFKITVPIREQVTPQATPEDTAQVTPQVVVQNERMREIITFCADQRSRKEIQTFLKIKDREYFRKEILKPLLDKQLLFLSIPDKPNSPKQKYYSKKLNDASKSEGM